jgi:hypothetical protein
MLFVGLFRNERIRDYEFWAALWQGPPPPKDFELIGAYNLMTDLRVLVFKAESTASIRFLDRLNFVGEFECHPALDQTEGDAHALARDTGKFTAFLRARGASEAVIKREVGFRAAASRQPTLMDAIRFGREHAAGRRKS